MDKARLVVGSSVKNENILWATKFFAPDPFVFLETEGKKIIVVSPLEYGRAKKEARVDSILLASELSANTEKKPLLLEDQMLFLLREYGVSSVTVNPDFPAELYQYLSENGVTIDFADPLFPERSVKTAEELEDIEYAQRSMEEVFPMLMEILAKAEIRDGKVWNNGEWVTSEMLKEIFEVELLRRNCVCETTVVASGDQAADPHSSGTGPILANTPIVFDLFPRSRRHWYFSDMTRMVVKGELSPEAYKLYEAVYEAQMAAVEMVKPGVDGYDIHNFVVKEFERRGFQTRKVGDSWEGFFHGTGHGLGLEIHELPRVTRIKGQILEPGNVITIEPGLYYPGIGGMRIEDTVVVTETGYKNLARLSRILLVLP